MGFTINFDASYLNIEAFYPFEDFMNEVNSRTGKKTKEEIKMDKNAKQIYLAARALDDFDKWVMFVVDML